MSSALEILFLKAKSAEKNGDAAASEEILRSILGKFPANARARKALQALAAKTAQPAAQAPDPVPPTDLQPLQALLRNGQFAEVLAQGRALAQRYPPSAALLNVLGSAALSLQRFEEAESLMRQALAVNPRHFRVRNNLGLALAAQGRNDEAEAAHREAIAINPDYANAHNALGVIEQEKGDLAAAIGAYRRAIELAPDYTDALNNLGTAQELRGDIAEAIACYRRALEIAPAHPDFLYNLGIALQKRGEADEAIATLEQALAANPRHADALKTLANALKDANRLDEAVALYDRALAVRPDFPSAMIQKLHLQAHICDWRGFAQFAGVAETLGVVGEPVSPFSALSSEDHPARHRVRAERWAADRFRYIMPQPIPRPAATPSRLRIGYFSADFFSHATMMLMAGLFRMHDAERFAIHAYSYGPSRDDAVRRDLANRVDSFVDIGAMSDGEVHALARRDGLDIAVDLKGFTQHNRTELFAARLAPVQISYLGFPGTMGADCFDYILADGVVVPPEQREHYSESVIRLPHSYQANDDQREIAATCPTRAELGLPEAAFVFCCFNNTYKIAPDVFAIWMRLLHQVEGSVLWLFRANPWAEANLRREAAAHGIDPARLVFAERLPPPQHLARHARADLFLDTFNYNAHTTASDALWAGLPLVTRPGKGFAARVGASLLNAVGLPELIAADDAAYEALALALARDPQRLAAIRAKLAEQRHHAPLFDTAGFTRAVETAYETAYARYFNGDAPADFTVG